MNTVPGVRLGILRRLARKELNEILRDRRTLLTLVLMPLLLYPLLGVAFRTFLFSGLTPPAAVYRLGVRPGDEGRAVAWFLRQGQKALRERESPKTAEGRPPPHQQRAHELRIEDSNDLEKDVMEERVHVAVRVAAPFNPGRLDQNLAADWELLYREDSPWGLEAARYVESVCAAANARFLSRRLNVLFIPQREAPVLALPRALRDPQARKPTLLPGLVPLILILMTITGAVYPAIDVTAGERERGTLEILVAAPVPRLDVLIAKYIAVLSVAMLTALVNLGSMTLTLYLSGIADKLLGPDALSPLVWLQVLLLLLLFAAFFSAVLLALTSFARSFKEAQAYLVPLMLLALMPGVLSLIPGLELRGGWALVPLLNVALLTRDLLEGNAHWFGAAVVVSATLLYAAIALNADFRVAKVTLIISYCRVQIKQTQSVADDLAAKALTGCSCRAPLRAGSGCGHVCRNAPRYPRGRPRLLRLSRRTCDRAVSLRPCRSHAVVAPTSGSNRWPGLSEPRPHRR